MYSAIYEIPVDITHEAMPHINYAYLWLIKLNVFF